MTRQRKPSISAAVPQSTLSIGAERDLVAEDVAAVGVGGAADPAQQRHVVDLAQLGLGQAERAGEADGEQAERRALDRVARAEVGRQRERGDDLGQARSVGSDSSSISSEPWPG